MSRTKIEWTRGDDGTKGETWNPITGCTKISAGCKNCYAERMTRRLVAMGSAKYAAGFDKVVCHESELDRPLHWRKPRRIFVCSMSDLFHTNVPSTFIHRVFDVMRRCPQHTFQVLTKRIVRATNGWTFPQNVWAGATMEKAAQCEARIVPLTHVACKTRFISFEPLLGPMPSDITQHLRYIAWAIIGCESGPNRRPMRIEWALDIVQQCTIAGAAVFVKQLPDPSGKVVKFHGGEWPDWVPVALRRQEFPEQERINNE